MGENNTTNSNKINELNMTKSEIKDVCNKEFFELCEYIEVNFMGYDISKGQRLQRDAVLRLRGLNKGQVIANNHASTHGSYPYYIIQLAMKMNKIKIQNAIRNKDFNSEAQKIGYICAIVRGQLNDVWTRYDKAQSVVKNTEKINSDVFEYQGAEYKSKKTTTRSQKLEDKFKDLW